jgi:hypothetical protein
MIAANSDLARTDGKESNMTGDRECVMCGRRAGSIPLNADKVPEAQPVAWTHTDCLSEKKDDDTSEE